MLALVAIVNPPSGLYQINVCMYVHQIYALINDECRTITQKSLCDCLPLQTPSLFKNRLFFCISKVQQRVAEEGSGLPWELVVTVVRTVLLA